MKKLTILGSTGSIGTQALTVTEKIGWGISALAAGGRNIALLEAQARKYAPEYLAVMDEAAAKDLKIKLADTNVKVEGGADAVNTAAAYDADMVLNSIVGIAGLKPTVTAIESGKSIALANKETLVTGGDIVMKKTKEKGVSILPVDSEHSAIFQSLMGVPNGNPYKILLTASGGPFFGKTKEELKNITPADALKHPNWDMGQKITIDSATLMNKGLEVIEAVHLFSVSADNIEVLVHRQSILHSAIELEDGAVIGQLGTPDMAIPIQFALTYPNRMPSPAPKLSLTDIHTLTFEKPDMNTFTCLATCISAIKRGGLYPTAANGANEKAVELFLKGKISFLQIGEFVAKATEACQNKKVFTLEDVFEADRLAREAVLSYIK
ncbi:MAG: 1-deoxy-D-xylulose-5-phosphate reductoisomerase [Clostridia bacterium]|nr:1-deoxy-D-xylulose-5-phosphate reductoisomerase [Clostridia bacterium]MBQ9919776.1 1-deoxy-D-xylulose-5-phosphate reductoisomerase [Clostridia bacterium]